MKKQRIYMDHIAGTPVAPEVLQAMSPFLQDHFGNPASIHHHGELPQDALFGSREQIARLIGAEKEEIIFTSCGTESNNLAVKGIAFNRFHNGKHLIVSSIEHYSVLYAAKALEKFGFDVSFVPVDALGRVDPENVRKTIRSDTVLVSVMLANNEVGTIQPLAEIARYTRERGIPLHTDAIAAAGRIPVNVQELGVDLLSLSANQFGGPKGAAALFCRKGVQIWPLFHGGGQEDGRRTGTENVAGIVGMGKAAELTMAALPERAKVCRRLEELLEKEISDRIDEVKFNGDPKNHLPGLVNVSISYVEGEALLLHMDMRGISVAGASACMSITAKASHVLEAMGALGDGAIGTLLFTLGEENTEEEVLSSVDTLSQVVTMLRAMSPLYGQRRG
ncbi:MAG: cysteine desulfurase family protein [Desulfoferrobacter sp.]